jgi:DNA-binding GntR family transcriptional regulator
MPASPPLRRSSRATPAETAAPAREPPPLDRSRHAAPQVVEYLRERIVGLDLIPGTVLSRSELAAQFGLSQTPIRDALIKLEEEGLVEIFAQHQTVVSRIDIRAAQQAHFLRRCIEIEIVRGLAKAPDRDLERRLRATIVMQTALLGGGDYQEFTRVDQSFHRQMYEAAGVPDLWDLVRRNSGHLDRLRRLHVPAEGKAQAIVRDHAAIVDAIFGADPGGAEASVRRHLSGTLAHVGTIRRRHAGYVTG